MRNHKGQSLIQVLVTMAVMGIMMAGMMTIQNNQSREGRAAADRIAKLDTARVLSSYFADSAMALCSYELATSRVVTFDDSHMPATASFSTPLSSIHSGANASSTELISVGKAVSPLSNTLIAKSITVSDISGIYPNYRGNLVISFDSSLLIRSLSNLSVPIKIVAVGATNIKTITSCASVGPSLTSCPAGQYSTGYDSLGNLNCGPPVYQ